VRKIIGMTRGVTTSPRWEPRGRTTTYIAEERAVGGTSLQAHNSYLCRVSRSHLHKTDLGHKKKMEGKVRCQYEKE